MVDMKELLVMDMLRTGEDSLTHINEINPLFSGMGKHGKVFSCFQLLEQLAL